MKKYITPDMKALAFAAVEAISADEVDSQFNDNTFGSWNSSGSLNQP